MTDGRRKRNESVAKSLQVTIATTYEITVGKHLYRNNTVSQSSTKTRRESCDQCRPFCCPETVPHCLALHSLTVCRRSSRLPVESSCRLQVGHGSRCVDQRTPATLPVANLQQLHMLKPKLIILNLKKCFKMN